MVAWVGPLGAALGDTEVGLGELEGASVVKIGVTVGPVAAVLHPLGICS